MINGAEDRKRLSHLIMKKRYEDIKTVTELFSHNNHTFWLYLVHRTEFCRVESP